MVNRITASQRLSPKERTEQILTAGVELASKIGYLNIRRDTLATAASCSVGLVTLRFKTMKQLRRAVMRRAVKGGVLKVVAQGLAAHDGVALAAPEELRRRAALALA